MGCRESVNFLDVEFDLINQDEALAWVAARTGSRAFSYVVTPNVDHVVQLKQSSNSDAVDAIADADLRICDSRILSLLATLSGLRLPVLPGSDLTCALLESSVEGTRVAMIGGDEAVLASLRSRYPQYQWTALYPPMGVRDNPSARREIVNYVCDGDAEIVFFAIGGPQSEIVCREIKLNGKASGTAICIGASLEFLTGAKKRAPLWMQRLALEWLFRLLSEPRRLWRRYLVVGPRVFVIWWNWHLLNRAR